MSKNSLFCPKKESSITQKVLIEIFFNVIFHLMYMVWLDLDAKSALDTGTPSVEAHKSAVYMSVVQIRPSICYDFGSIAYRCFDTTILRFTWCT